MTALKAQRTPEGLEILTRVARGARRSTSVVFVHGIHVGAWVWEPEFLSFFAQAGFDSYALSLRGHGESAGRSSLALASLGDYADDLAAAVRFIGQPTVLVGHSLGGAVVQRYLRDGGKADGFALLASVPPWGLLPSMLRLLWSDPSVLITLTRASSGKRPSPHDPQLRRALFSDGASDDSIRRMAAKFGPESRRIAFDLQGWAPIAPRSDDAPPALVLGGCDDRLIAPHDVHRTGAYYGCGSEVLTGVAHAFMLEPTWRIVAERLMIWLEQRFANSTASAR